MLQAVSVSGSPRDVDPSWTARVLTTLRTARRWPRAPRPVARDTASDFRVAHSTAASHRRRQPAPRSIGSPRVGSAPMPPGIFNRLPLRARTAQNPHSGMGTAV